MQNATISTGFVCSFYKSWFKSQVTAVNTQGYIALKVCLCSVVASYVIKLNEVERILVKQFCQ